MNGGPRPVHFSCSFDRTGELAQSHLRAAGTTSRDERNDLSWPAVVVGFDGSAVAAHATRWAAVEAMRRNCPLHVVQVLEPAMYEGARAPVQVGTGGRPWHPHVRELRAEVRACRAAHEGLDVRTHVLADGSPVGRLTERTRTVGAGAIVVGSAEPDGESGSMPVSAGAELAAATTVPVIVVRRSAPRAEATSHLRVVAVCDDGATSARVLRSAFDLAGRWGAELAVVHVERRARGQVRGVAAHVFRRQMRGCSALYPHVSARVSSVGAQPAPAVLAVSQDAGLLVVGDRGRGLGQRLTAGTVSHTVLRHARCSVALV